MNSRASKDGDCVRLLQSSGAIPLCITNNSEACRTLTCSNQSNGKTMNPYNGNRSSGGSNGGEAALLACGGSVIGVGSDLAGSIRLSALFCGVFGHKPTARVVNCEGFLVNKTDKKYENYLTLGPMTRYAKDLRLMVHILSDKNAKLRLESPIHTKSIKVIF